MDERAKNKRSVYMNDVMLEEVQEAASQHGITLSRTIADAWKIARDCKCRVPEGVVLFAEARGGDVD